MSELLCGVNVLAGEGTIVGAGASADPGVPSHDGILNCFPGGGGGLDISVVGGTTQPENPRNNTIWINTDMDIGKVYFSPTRPDTHANGDVWVNTAYNDQDPTENPLQVVANPSLMVNILQLYQFDGDDVVWRGGGIYTNNTWTNMALYLFYYGIAPDSHKLHFASVSGGYDGNLFYSNDCFEVELGALENVWVQPDIDGGIDLMPFSKATVKYTVSDPTLMWGKHSIVDNNGVRYRETSLPDVNNGDVGRVTFFLPSDVSRGFPELSIHSNGQTTFRCYYWVLS